jgi:transposase
MTTFNPLDFFLNPKTARQKQYDALREYYLKDLTQKEAAKKHGYSPSSFQSLVRDFKNQRIVFFLPMEKTPKKKIKSDAVRDKVVILRKRNHSIYEIKKILQEDGFLCSLDTINRILREERFSKLPRRTKEELGFTKKSMITPPIATQLNLDYLDDYKFECQVGGIYYFIPYIINTGLYEQIIDSSFPETTRLSNINSIFSILALKLMGHERLSRIVNYNLDSGFGFFAGLNVPPKSTATSTYSYRVDKDTIHAFLENFILNMNTNFAHFYQGETINLDFHSIPHYGEKSIMENNWVGAKHHSMKSALTFFAQDGESRMLVYENTDIDRKDAPDEISNFVNYWLRIKGIIEQTLVFDSKLTTYEKLEELDKDNVKFITLRRRGKNLIENVDQIPDDDWIPVDLKKKKRKHNKFKISVSEITLPRTKLKVRQVIFKDHGREVPTFLITNNFDIELETLALHYSNRWLIENKFSEIVDFFNLNALNSPFMIRIYFDVVLTIVADTLYRLLAQDLKRFENCTPKTIFSDFINCRCKGQIIGNNIVIRMKKKATSPLFMSNETFRKVWPAPWLGNKNIRYEWMA